MNNLLAQYVPSAVTVPAKYADNSGIPAWGWGLIVLVVVVVVVIVLVCRKSKSGDYLAAISSEIRK